MKIIKTQILLLLFWGSCSNNHPKQTIAQNAIFPDGDTTEVNIKEKQGINEFVNDTVLERNNPNALDLTQHQLFIDTTRNSKLYKALMDWKPRESAIHSIKNYIDELDEISKSKKVDFGAFPRLFVQIHIFEGEFYLYDRCDGIDSRYELRDSAFIFYKPMEPYAETIKYVHHITKKGIALELNTFKTKTLSGSARLEILKTKHEEIYLLKYQKENYFIEEFIIPFYDISKYDLVVNNCPTMKMDEFAPFN